MQHQDAGSEPRNARALERRRGQPPYGAGTVRRIDRVTFCGWPTEVPPLGDGQAVFTLYGPGGFGVWTTDGTRVGTIRLAARTATPDRSISRPGEHVVLEAPTPDHDPPHLVMLAGAVTVRGGVAMAAAIAIFRPMTAARHHD